MLEALGPEYPLEGLSKLTAGADLVFVNLECALSARQQRFTGATRAFYFHADPATVRALTAEASIWSPWPTTRCLMTMSPDRPIRWRSWRNTGSPAPAPAPIWRPRTGRGWNAGDGGWGVLAVCDHQAEFAAAHHRPGIHCLSLEDARCRRLRVERVCVEAPRFDHLIVSLHWLPNRVPSIPQVYRELAGELIDAGARVAWGHSPHHILGTQWWAGGVAMYSTGDLIDDYALDPHFRNDRQLLYLVELGEACVARVLGYPMRLRLGRAEPADHDVRRWIEAWLREACRPLGSEPVDSDHAFERSDPAHRRACRGAAETRTRHDLPTK